MLTLPATAVLKGLGGCLHPTAHPYHQYPRILGSSLTDFLAAPRSHQAHACLRTFAPAVPATHSFSDEHSAQMSFLRGRLDHPCKAVPTLPPFYHASSLYCSFFSKKIVYFGCVGSWLLCPGFL